MKLNGKVLSETEIVALTLEDKKVWYELAYQNIFTFEEIEKYFSNINWNIYCFRFTTSNYKNDELISIFQMLLDNDVLDNSSLTELCVNVPMDKEFMLKNKNKLKFDVIFLGNKKAEKFTKTEMVKYGLINVPKVGEHCTKIIGSDRYPYEVVEVSKSGLQCKIRKLDVKPAEGFDYFSNQEYIYSSNENNSVEIIKMNNKGVYTNNKMRIKFGIANYYQDPCF